MEAQTARPKNMDLFSELLQLEAWATEELAAQRELSQALARQEDAIRTGSTEGLIEASAGVQDAVRGQAQRERRRVAGLRALARRFGVAAETLTLKSISERAQAAGYDCSRLDRARANIREAAADALKRGRRIATIARHHRSLLDDLFHELAGQTADRGDTSQKGALLVNREA